MINYEEVIFILMLNIPMIIILIKAIWDNREKFSINSGRTNTSYENISDYTANFLDEVTLENDFIDFYIGDDLVERIYIHEKVYTSKSYSDYIDYYVEIFPETRSYIVTLYYDWRIYSTSEIEEIFRNISFKENLTPEESSPEEDKIIIKETKETKEEKLLKKNRFSVLELI